jgi:hypothetical protein
LFTQSFSQIGKVPLGNSALKRKAGTALTSAPDVSPNLTEQERLYGISELAEELGITARAIRF